MTRIAAALASLLALAAPPLAAQTAGNAFNPTVQPHPYLEPHIPRPEQDAAAAQKLAAPNRTARSGTPPTMGARLDSNERRIGPMVPPTRICGSTMKKLKIPI